MLLLALHLTRAHADELVAVDPYGAPPVEERAPVGWAAHDALYAVQIPQEGPLTFTLTWRLVTPKRAWAELPLVGPGLVVHSVSGPVTAGPGGLFALLPPTEDRATIVVRGTLDPQNPGAATLRVLPAARQRVVIDAPGLDVTVRGATDGWLAAADTLALTWGPRTTEIPAPPRPIVHAEAATAVWAEPGALLSQTVARWKVVRGTVDRFELDVAGLEEVDATGPNLGRATREGNRLVLTPRTPVKGTFSVRVRARRSLRAEDAGGDDEVPAPAPRPLASRVERYWTVGRAEDGELVPVGGPRTVALRTLPEWGRGLSDTPIVSSWQGDTPLRVRLARYTPLMGPDTVVERAVMVVAAAVEGRALARTTWHVRNERRQYLHVTPPPGMRPITARVSGDPVLVLSDGAGGVYVPLEKSVETVQGLLTFPVELTWIAEGPAWERRGERALTLPAVDAPIQAAEWEVYLPRGVTSKEATAAAPPPEEEAGEDELQMAVEAYKKNDFASSRFYLEQARSSGSTSANVDRLQSNLDVLFDDTKDTGAEDVATRRVRELANAKTVDLQVEQDKKAEEARRAYERGDVEEAEAYLEDVLALAEDIGVTEQKESAEQELRVSQASELLVAVKKQKAASAGALGAKGGKRGKMEPEIVGGVEGGVVGGVLGGVLGGVVAPEPAAGESVPEAGADGWGAEGLGAGGGPPQRPPEVVEPVVEDEDDAVERRGDTTIELDAIVVTGVLSNTPGVAARGRATKAPAAPSARKAPDVAAAKPAQPSTTAPPPPTPPPPNDAPPNDAPPDEAPAGRAALDVKAAPLTLAMPLGGQVVRETAALLPAGATPTLTVPYRTTGADR